MILCCSLCHLWSSLRNAPGHKSSSSIFYSTKNIFHSVSRLYLCHFPLIFLGTLILSVAKFTEKLSSDYNLISLLSVWFPCSLQKWTYSYTEIATWTNILGSQGKIVNSHPLHSFRRLREKFEIETRELEQSERRAVKKYNEIKVEFNSFFFGLTFYFLPMYSTLLISIYNCFNPVNMRMNFDLLCFTISLFFVVSHFL